MKNKYVVHLIGVGVLFSFIAFFSGCGSSIGSFSTLTDTQTQLNRNNFRVIENGVRGSASCSYLLSAIPLGSMDLYGMAMNQIRRKANAQGKAIAIVNVTRDISYISYIIVSEVTLTLTADIIEFIDNPQISKDAIPKKENLKAVNTNDTNTIVK
jgi:hypothetical protein